MKILNEFPERITSGRREKYPWKEWFDGQIRQLDRGEDFDSEPKNFRVAIQDKARKEPFNGRAVTQLTSDGNSVVVQFIKN